MGKITKETTLAEILEISKADKVLAKYNLPCLTCPFAGLEMNQLTLGQICDMYKIDIDSLLEDLNKLS